MNNLRTPRVGLLCLTRSHFTCHTMTSARPLVFVRGIRNKTTPQPQVPQHSLSLSLYIVRFTFAVARKCTYFLNKLARERSSREQCEPKTTEGMGARARERLGAASGQRVFVSDNSILFTCYLSQSRHRAIVRCHRCVVDVRRRRAVVCTHCLPNFSHINVIGVPPCRVVPHRTEIWTRNMCVRLCVYTCYSE